MISPLVSIIIPVYNREDLIIDTLQSITSQTYENWECIIVDDGSTDDTVDTISKYIAGDKRFALYQRGQNLSKGANVCRNLGFYYSKGELIQWLDSDDLLSPEKITKQVNALGSSQTKIATCRWHYFSDDLSEINKSRDLKSFHSFDDPEKFLKALAVSEGYFPPHSYLIPKPLILKSGLWMENLSLNQDAVFMAGIFCNMERTVHVSDADVYYRVHKGDRISSLSSIEKVLDGVASWRLIESMLQIRFKKRHLLLTDNAISHFGIKVKQSYPEVFESNRSFLDRNENPSLGARLARVYRLLVHGK